jgi:hypothetical protein
MAFMSPMLKATSTPSAPSRPFPAAPLPGHQSEGNISTLPPRDIIAHAQTPAAPGKGVRAVRTRQPRFSCTDHHDISSHAESTG